MPARQAVLLPRPMPARLACAMLGPLTMSIHRTFVRALKKRPDVTVDTAKLGRKIRKADVKAAQDLHPELGELYALMNGIHVEWRFIVPPAAAAFE